MDDVIIRVEGLGKKYRIRHERAERYTALRDVIADKLRGALSWGRSSPERVVELHNNIDMEASARADTDEIKSNLQAESVLPDASSVEDFWALRDVSFEVRRGEVVGIIGRNGAGKSTLLKILSRITEPTEGRVELDGRVASLLEVGTGFHPELTGRENIFLNGAILGMTRAEIRRKFDEIVAFAEVEKFLDTPVKRYSSGMYVRLAFSVAAHLEPEILIVDEVLAVGDAEFQKKCLGKMHEVSKGGRTVLFVSHNMAATKSLTTRGIVLDHGCAVFMGPSELAIDHYTQLSSRRKTETNVRSWGRGTHTSIRSARLLDASGGTAHHYQAGKPLQLEVVIETDGQTGMSLEAFLLDAALVKLGLASLYQFHGQSLPAQPGVYSCLLKLSPQWLASGSYSVDLATSVVNSNWDHSIHAAVEFDVPFCNPHGLPWNFEQSYGFGSIALLCDGPAVFTQLAEN
jgi:lipopolysaccharide transport system ATP-binding protein